MKERLFRGFAVCLVLVACVIVASCTERKEQVSKPTETLPPETSADEVALPDSPWNAIGRVNRQRGGFCSGVLIAPDKVLTSAHCVWDSELGRWIAPQDLHFLAGFHRERYASHRRASGIEVPRGIEMTAGGIPARAVENWAILTLERPIGPETNVRPLPFADLDGGLRPKALGSLVRAGYGPRRPYVLESSRCNAVTLMNPLVLLHDCGASIGDSGFPILVETNGDWQLLGLQMISAAQTGEGGGLGMALLVSAITRDRRLIVSSETSTSKARVTGP